jgi:hypothetical protein
MAKNVKTQLLKEVISIRFDQNLPQGDIWPTEHRIWQMTNSSQKKSEVTLLFYVVQLQ